MSQSKVRSFGGSVPPSFGRQLHEQPPAEEFRVVGGQAFMALTVDVRADPESLGGLYQAVRAAVSQAIRDAYQETVGVELPPPVGGDERPAGGDGGTSAG